MSVFTSSTARFRSRVASSPLAREGAVWRRGRTGQLDLPLGRDDSGRFLPWIIALMVYLSAIGGLGLVLLGDGLRDWDRSLSGRLTVELPAGTSSARADSAVALFRNTKGVTGATLLSPAEMARLLQPWLGDSVSVQSLPLPILIDVHVDPDASVDIATLRERLAAIAPSTRLEDHRLWLDRLRSFALRVESVISAIVLAVAAMMVLTVVFATRTGLAIHSPVVEILYLVGARDSYIAAQFQTHALRLGLRGGAIGVAAAAVTLFLLGRAASALDLPIRLAENGLLDLRVWVLLIGLVLAAGGIAMATARITVLRQLAWLP